MEQLIRVTLRTNGTFLQRVFFTDGIKIGLYDKRNNFSFKVIALSNYSRNLHYKIFKNIPRHILEEKRISILKQNILTTPNTSTFQKIYYLWECVVTKELHELEEGRPLPIHGVTGRHGGLQEVPKEVKVRDESPRERPQQLEQQLHFGGVVLHEAQQALREQLRLTPLRVVDRVCFQVALLGKGSIREV